MKREYITPHIIVHALVVNSLMDTISIISDSEASDGNGTGDGDYSLAKEPSWGEVGFSTATTDTWGKAWYTEQ